MCPWTRAGFLLSSLSKSPASTRHKACADRVSGPALPPSALWAVPFCPDVQPHLCLGVLLALCGTAVLSVASWTPSLVGSRAPCGHVCRVLSPLSFLAALPAGPAPPALDGWECCPFFCFFPFPASFQLETMHFSHVLLEVVLSISTYWLLCPELLEQSHPSPPAARKTLSLGDPACVLCPPGHRGDCWRLCRPGRCHCSERGRRCLGAAPLSDVLLDLSGREYLWWPHGLMSKSVVTDSRGRCSCRTEVPSVSPLQPQAALAGVGSSLPCGMVKTDPCVPCAPRCGHPGAALPRPWVAWGACRRAGLSHLLSRAIPSEWTGHREHPWPRPPALLEVLPASL